MQDKVAFAELIYDSTDDMMVIMSVDANGVYIIESVNRAYLEARGLDKVDIVGKQPHEIHTAAEAAIVIDHFKQLIESKKPISYTEEIQLVTRVVYVETKLSAIYDVSGQCTHILGVSRDVAEQSHVRDSAQRPVFDIDGAISGTGGIVSDTTELKEAQAQSAVAQENFKKMFNVVPIGMALVDPLTGIVLEANNEYLETLGRERSELGQLTWNSMTHPEELERATLNAKKILSGSTQSYKRLKRYIHTDGSTVWAQLSVEALAGMGVEEQPKVLVMLQDISKHKESEAELEYKTSFLAAQHENPTEGIITINSEHVVLTYNRKFIELWNISSEIIALNSGPVALKDLLRKVVNPRLIMRNVRRKGTKLDLTQIDEVELKDGRVFEVRSTAMLGSNDQFYGWLWTTRDLTQIKLQEEQVRRSMKMNALAMLTAGITHDYSNMLSVILGYAELISNGKGETPEQIQEYLSQIISAAQRGKSLTGKLLSFSKYRVTEQEPVDLNAKLLDMRALLGSMLDNDVQLSVKESETPCYANLDLSDFENAVVNLVLNSTFAMPRGGRLTLSVEHQVIETLQAKTLGVPSGNYVSCMVKDEGEGIAENIQSKIFDPFFTTKDERGTGLGLSQVFGFMQRSAGTISVESKVGEGTCVRLYFPAIEPPVASDNELPRFTQATKSKVLVVDDERELQSLVCEYLKRNGYEALGVSNAEDALKVLKQQQIDVLITDIVMPGMNGFELTSAVASEYPELKILMTSGYNQVIDLEFVERRDNIAYLQKPYALEELVVGIQALH